MEERRENKQTNENQASILAGKGFVGEQPRWPVPASTPGLPVTRAALQHFWASLMSSSALDCDFLKIGHRTRIPHSLHIKKT